MRPEPLPIRPPIPTLKASPRIPAPMNRRTLLKALGLPVITVTGALGWVTAARSKNRYYDGPISDHFDGVRFFTPGQPQDKGLLELARWRLGGGRKGWPE